MRVRKCISQSFNQVRFLSPINVHPKRDELFSLGVLFYFEEYLPYIYESLPYNFSRAKATVSTLYGETFPHQVAEPTLAPHFQTESGGKQGL